MERKKNSIIFLKSNDFKFLVLLFFLAIGGAVIISRLIPMKTTEDTNFLLSIHKIIGNLPFLLSSLIIAAVLCFKFIPDFTNLMTNSAAGLTEVHLGKKSRTLVINCTTNLPELFLMLISLIFFKKLGGIATPLGSNFANIYLIFLIAPLFIIFKWIIKSEWKQLKKLLRLLIQEYKLVAWHLLISSTIFVFAVIAYWLITGELPVPFSFIPENVNVRTGTWLLLGTLCCLIGICIFIFFEKRFTKKHPDLLENIEDENFDTSWKNFFVGTLGLIICCFILNSFFVTLSQIYQPTLSRLFGENIFLGLHFFIGSLISSLPEIIVAIENYERVTSSDLNTALASASVSNMSNLAIAAFGSLLACLVAVK